MSRAAASCQDEGPPRWTSENNALARLVERAAAGCPDAFEELYLRTSRWLLFQVRRWVDERDAEDVLAEVYIQVWQDACKYDASRAPATVWMAVIARSRALDHLRRRRPETAELPADERASEDDPQSILERRQQHQLIHRTLDTAGLSACEREVICMAYFAENTQQEIASATGMPLGTVKSTMLRAQSKVRRQLAPAAMCFAALQA